MTNRKPSLPQLREAALAIAKRRHPDQTATVSPNAFAQRNWTFTEVSTSGGFVLVSRAEAEAEATK